MPSDVLNFLDLVTEGGVTLADYDWDTLSRRHLVRLNGNALTADFGYEADDDLNSIAHTGPAPLTFTLGRNASSQITSLAASDGALTADGPLSGYAGEARLTGHVIT